MKYRIVEYMARYNIEVRVKVKIKWWSKKTQLVWKPINIFGSPVSYGVCSYPRHDSFPTLEEAMIIANSLKKSPIIHEV